ncbi:aminotransferase class I/II-fold pyridoxal phosphate-dependent enzyme [Mycolicibacter heraklionensis]|uniref:Aminotransferase class I/II-fold pyridoxal phosphate-dependent enzyme n=1 Tax=Mycolicibacter heraklionensis TaxID=512402 RepID=A0A9X7ZFJ8_9MYCO|nr:aminotransferase class I/II-fold pyridoxal phosphate-dependent enzyme [Mycolicibacter heraklionensis]QZA06845.1 aminotransferase class I/II-fold pyridoxal phosphate-dependent enzyme [Mycolicibacter heraklionensis]
MAVQYRISGEGAEAIAASVEEGIADGALAPGAALPPIRGLAQQLGVNPNTVAAAYRLLRDRGAVESSGRRGTRVRDRPATTPRSLRGLAVPPNVRDLSTGNPNPALLPVIAAVPGPVVLYGDPPIAPALAEHAASELAADGVPADHLAVTSGALDGIERVLSAQLRPGDRVAVEDPGWPNLLDLLGALGLTPEPVGVDDDGPLPADLARALRRGVRAVVVTSRAQNPTGAAVSAERANVLRGLLDESEVLLIEDDHGAAIAGVPLHPLAGVTRRWAFVRSAAKAYGPDLRLAVLAGDQRTVERVQGRQRLGPGWVSHLLQNVAVELWDDAAAARRVADAEAAYRAARVGLCTALADRGVVAHGRSGLNVWIPVSDEAVAMTALFAAGWAAAPGARFRIRGTPGLRVTIAELAPADVGPLADAIAAAVRGPGRGSV